MASADTEGSLRERAEAIAACEDKRRLLIEAWPSVKK